MQRVERTPSGDEEQPGHRVHFPLPPSPTHPNVFPLSDFITFSYELTDSWIYQVINFSPKIEVLQIYHASLRANTVPMITRGCKNLRSLTLGKCSEVKELTSHLETLTTLERLSLRNTPVRDSALQVMMTAFPYLQTLTLIGMFFSLSLSLSLSLSVYVCLPTPKAILSLCNFHNRNGCE